MARQDRNSLADELQQQEAEGLLRTADGISSEPQQAFDAAEYPAVASWVAQQQQLRSVNQHNHHAQTYANDGLDQAPDGYKRTSLLSCKQLVSLIWSNGYVCMLLAAFIFSLSVLCVKLTGNRVPVLQITLARSILSFIISTVLIKARGIKPMFGHRQHSVWLIGRGVSGALAMMTFYVAILKLPLADANTLFFLNPCMTAVAAWMFLGESLGLLGVVGCLLSLLGLVLITHPPMLFGGPADWGPQRMWGTMFGLAAAVGATGAFICIRFIGKAEPAIVVALYFHTSTMVMSAIPLTLAFPQPAAWMSPTDMLLLLGVAGTSFFGQLSLTRGFQLLNASKAAGMNFSQVLWGYIFGIVLFGESVTLFGVLGTCLIAVGMVCVTMRNKSSADKNQQDDKLDLHIRNQAAEGYGSLLLTSQQQQQQRSSSFAARLHSFQRLLERGRYGAPAADNEEEGGEREANDSSAFDGLPLRYSATAASGTAYRDQDVGSDTVLGVQQQQSAGLSNIRNIGSSMVQMTDRDPAAAAAAAAFSNPVALTIPLAAGDAEPVSLGHIQHRNAGFHCAHHHHHHHQQQQQQQQQEGGSGSDPHRRSPGFGSTGFNVSADNNRGVPVIPTSLQEAALRMEGRRSSKGERLEGDLVKLSIGAPVVGGEAQGVGVFDGSQDSGHDAFVEIPLRPVQHEALQPLWSVSGGTQQ